MASLTAAGYRVLGVGIVSEKSESHGDSEVIKNIELKRLKSRTLKSTPRIIKHVLEVAELSMKFYWYVRNVKADIIHCHDVQCLPVATLLARMHDAKLIYDSHELQSDRNGISRLLGKLTVIVERFLWKNISGLIVVSKSIGSWYTEHIGSLPTEVIYNAPVSSDQIATDENYLRQHFNIPNHETIYIYIGLFVKGRGIEDAIYTFSNMTDAHLVFMGHGDLEGEIHRAVAVNENIHLHQAVPHDEVTHIARSADVGLAVIENISLSDYLCLPNKVFEYACSGLQIIGSNFPEISDMLELHDLGLTYDPETQRLSEVVFAMENRLVQSVSGSRLDKLTWQAQEKKLVEFYQFVGR